MKKVLIVDDAQSIVKILEVKFKNKGWEVRSAQNGLEALNVLKDFSPDIMFVDIMMPKMDGYQFSMNIKKEDKFKNIPLILITGVGQYEDQLKGLQSGIDEYITKPFDPDEVYQLACDFTDLNKKELLTKERNQKEAKLKTILEIMQREKE